MLLTGQKAKVSKLKEMTTCIQCMVPAARKPNFPLKKWTQHAALEFLEERKKKHERKYN